MNHPEDNTEGPHVVCVDNPITAVGYAYDPGLQYRVSNVQRRKVRPVIVPHYEGEAA